MKSRIGILALLIILLASITSAQYTEDFSVAYEPTLLTEQGTIAQSHFQVTNTGSIASGYSIGVKDSEAATWLRMSPLSFTLQPGQTQIIATEYHIPLGQDTGKYNLETVFSTTLGTVQVLEQKVKVTVPQNIELSTPAEFPLIEACGTADYDITVTNTGVFTEEYTLTVSKNVAELAEFTADTLNLEAGDSETTTLSITPVDCNAAGSTEFSVTATATSTEREATLDLILEVENTFIPSIEASDFRVSSQAESYNFTLTNTGSEEATYDLSLAGPDFLSLEESSITLGSEETTSIVLISEPVEGTEQAIYDATLAVTVEELDYLTEFKVNLKDPTWIERNTLLFTIIIIVAVVLILLGLFVFSKWHAYSQTPEYAEKKKEAKRKAAENKRKKAAKKERKAKAREKKKAERAAAKAAKKAAKSKEAKAAAAQKEKEAKEKEQAKLQAKIDKEKEAAAAKKEKELRAKNVVIAKKKLKGDLAKGKSGLWWLLDIIFVVIILVLLYGFRVQIMSNLTRSLIIGGVIVAVIVLWWVIYKLFGDMKASQKWYALKPKKNNKIETKWCYGLGMLYIRVKEVLPKAHVKLRGSTKLNPAFVPPEGHVRQYITLNGLETADVESLKVQFKVHKCWLDKRNIPEGNVKLQRATPDGWKGIKTDKVKEDKKCIYFEATYTGNAETLAIVGKEGAKKPKKKSRVALWTQVTVLLLIAVMFGVLYLGSSGQSPGFNDPRDGIPDQVWDEDNKHTLDLGEFFVDPDGDALAYTYTPVEDIVVTISGNEVTFLPKKDFFGERTITFTADDGKGGIVSSNEVTLTVLDAAEPTFWDHVWTGLQAYSLYIFAGALILLLLLFGLEYSKKPAAA
jgi:flagellar basal body-associated protein FliL